MRVMIHYSSLAQTCVQFKEWRHPSNHRRGPSCKICLCTGFKCNNNDYDNDDDLGDGDADGDLGDGDGDDKVSPTVSIYT